MFDKAQKLHMQESSSSSFCSPVIEAEYINLPSLGMFYKGKYKNVTTLKVKKLSYLEEDLLTLQSYYDNGSLFEEILKSVIIDKEFPVGDLVEIDKVTILYWLYIYAFGRSYETMHTCDRCKKQTKITWDLGSFNIPDYPIGCIKDLLVKGSMEITLNGIKFNLVPSTFNRSFRAEQFLKQQISTGKTYAATKKLLTSIIAIDDGKNILQDIDSIYNWLKTQSLSLKDSRFIQERIKELEIEPETEKVLICNHCNEEVKEKFPMSIHFFRIDPIKYKEYLEESINFLHFWGKLDYNSCINMSVHKRKAWIEMTNKNLEILYPKSK